VSGVVGIARALGVTVLAEGVETAAELSALRSIGITLVQGYHFAKPLLKALPPVAGFAPVTAARAA
jgi:EAL domain-containing protein (putative c-di-GMP-specific phosphodiesterase class I)